MMAFHLFNRRKHLASHADGEVKLCENLDFAATEAYKLLRANLLFTLPDTAGCRVVGVTSSVRGEGKSTTSINLAYALAATGKKVLLIDADLRLPSVAKKLKISATKGLSDVLLQPQTLGEALRAMRVSTNWHILLAGSIPPNPSEMLGSAQMKRLVERLKENYDFIVLDLPPVNIVSDALAVAPLLDGMMVVVRRNFSTRRELNQCQTQLELSGVKVLGFVFSHVGGGGGSRYKYKYKSKRYGYERYGYENASPEQQE
jgi:capsular exopolysaccharide synthesis family protein